MSSSRHLQVRIIAKGNVPRHMAEGFLTLRYCLGGSALKAAILKRTAHNVSLTLLVAARGCAIYNPLSLWTIELA